MTKSVLTRSETAALADSLRRTLGLIYANELSAKPRTTHRLEGALIALEAVLGARSNPLEELSKDDRL